MRGRRADRLRSPAGLLAAAAACFSRATSLCGWWRWSVEATPVSIGLHMRKHAEGKVALAETTECGVHPPACAADQLSSHGIGLPWQGRSQRLLPEERKRQKHAA